MSKDDIVTIKERTVEVSYVDLKELINEVKELRADLKSERNKPNNGAEILTAKDVMKDLRIGRTALDQRLYNWDNPMPMVREGNRLKIRRDKYEAWKQAQGL